MNRRDMFFIQHVARDITIKVEGKKIVPLRVHKFDVIDYAYPSTFHIPG